jgi:hypothetical protein
MSTNQRSFARAALALAVVAAAMSTLGRDAAASPVEYVKICQTWGAGYFYIPGTDICQNANAIGQTENALSSQTTSAYRGVAISSSIVAPFMPSTANYAVSAHWATFSGQNALGLGGLARVSNSNFFLSGGIGAATSGGSPVGRAGFMYAW